MKISKKEKISCFLQVLRYFLKKDKSISLQIKKENKEKNTSEKEEEINYHYIYIIIKRKQWTKRVKKLRWRSYCRGGGIWRLCWANTTHQPLRSGLIWAPRWCWHIYQRLSVSDSLVLGDLRWSCSGARRPFAAPYQKLRPCGCWGTNLLDKKTAKMLRNGRY